MLNKKGEKNMENERKKESFIEKIKGFFRKLFKKEQVTALPNPEPEKIEKDKDENNVLNINKEESLKLYNDVKNNKVSLDSLTREQLIMFITLANEEIKILDKKIDNEITEINMYRKEIDFYEKKLGEEV